MDAPWFLTFFGLSPGADERAVKRAYAVRLKKIDQESDLEGFARLRQAYEAALHWLATQAPGPAKAAELLPPQAEQAVPAPGARVLPQPPPAPAAAAAVVPLPVAAQQAHAAMEALADALRAGEPAREALAAQLARLHDGHLEAGALFEYGLVDALARGAVPDRVPLFAAACEALGWMDVTRLAQLGPRGQWIGSVLTEEPAWRQRAHAFAGAHWFEWIEQGRHAELPGALASQWPRVVLLLRQCPQQLRLRLSPATLGAWQASFNALPALDRGLAETYAGPPSPAAHRRARPRVAESRRGAPVWSIVLGVFLVLRLVGSLVGGSQTQTYPPVEPPAASTQQAPSTAELCARVDAGMHMPNAPRPRDERERRQLVDLVRHCIVTGQWRALPDPQLEGLGFGNP